MTANSTSKLTTADMIAAMRLRYAQPQWAILFEVPDATGGPGNQRIDALAMSLWPSRGLELHGFEIKVSRSDWRRELNNPRKAEKIAGFCDRWYVVAPPDVVPIEELPPAWGLLTWDAKRWALRKEAEKTPVKEITRPFLAALLRAVHVVSDAEVKALVDAKDKERKETMDKEIHRHIKMHSDDSERLRDSIAKFEAASGVKIDEWNGGSIGAAVKLIRTIGIGTLNQRAYDLVKQHERAAANLRQALSAVDFSEQEKPSDLVDMSKARGAGMGL